jgi:hypothetical protein
MIEIMALFSILSKIIVVDNVSGSVKEFFGLMDRLDELESNTYKSLGYQKVEQTQARIRAVQNYQQEVHQAELKQIAQHSSLPYQGLSSLPSTLGTYATGQVGTEQPKKEKEVKRESIIKPLGNQGVEAQWGQKKVSKVVESSKVKALDLNLYDEAEQKLLKILWDNGNIKVGESLISRRAVLKEAGTLKGKSGVLTNLYEKLLTNDFIEFNVRYIAKAELAKKLYQELA